MFKVVDGAGVVLGDADDMLSSGDMPGSAFTSDSPGVESVSDSPVAVADGSSVVPSVVSELPQPGNNIARMRVRDNNLHKFFLIMFFLSKY